MNDTHKRALSGFGHSMKRVFTWMISHRQQLIFLVFLLLAISYFIYTLGYASNWAYIVTETRGTRFYRASQAANRMMNQMGFILLVLVLLALGFGTATRKKYYLSNVVLTVSSSVLMMVTAVLTFYYNSVLKVMYANIPEEDIHPDIYRLYGLTKSYKIFDIGFVLSGLMAVMAMVMIVYVIGKLRQQKERAQLIERMVALHEHES